MSLFNRSEATRGRRHDRKHHPNSIQRWRVISAYRATALSRTEHAAATKGRANALAAMLVTLAIAPSMTGCDPRGTGQELIGRCGGDARFQVVELDDSPTQATSELVAAKVEIVRALATKTSEECGRLRVERFRGSRTDSDVIVDRNMTPGGKSPDIRRRNRGQVVEEVVQTVASALKPGVDGGSAPLAALAHGRDMLRQKGGAKNLHLFVATDGIETEAVNLATSKLSVDSAQQFIQDAGPAIPELKGITVVVAGIGRVNGRQPPTSYTNGLLAFWNQVCARATAAVCTVLDQLAIPTRQEGNS